MLLFCIREYFMFSYLNHCKEHLTYENFINSLEFKEGYCKFNLTKSYIGSGYIIADFELNLIQKYKEKVLADGYILKIKDGSDNFFRDDINTYIYIPSIYFNTQFKEWYSYLNCFFTLAFFSTFCFLILEYSK